MTVQQIETGTVSIRLRGALDLAYAYKSDDVLRRAEHAALTEHFDYVAAPEDALRLATTRTA